MKVVFDMETADPDDVATLLWLIARKDIELSAVTVTPGYLDQIGLIKGILQECNLNIPVGGNTANIEKKGVSQFYHKIFSVSECVSDGMASDILHKCLKKDVRLLTGAPLKNPHSLYKQYPDTYIDYWIGQGGFAGDSVVPKEYRLSKFDGKETCETFNFNGDIDGAKLLTSSLNIYSKRLVSKNVCHGVFFTEKQMHQLKQINNSKSLNLLIKMMSYYLSKHPDGKKFHDPLAAVAMINPDIFEWREVEVYREKGKWGSKLKTGTNTWITVKVNENDFWNEFFNLDLLGE